MKNKNKIKIKLITIFIFIISSIITYYYKDINNLLEENLTFLTKETKSKTKKITNRKEDNNESSKTIKIEKYNNSTSIILNNNEPTFTEEDLKVDKENYSDLDKLGRCQKAIAKVGIDTMPTKKRETIGYIKPSGWHTIKYDIVEGKYLYNRCHLIGYQLTGENANPKNLITCTRYMNTKGMLDYENEVASYVRKTKNHVLYKVTPIFEEENLLATGVQIEAKSIEDDGKGVKFNVFVYNVQEGIKINYKTGESSME